VSVEPRWVPKSTVVAIHEIQLAAHGGVPGLRDDGLLESALARPRNLFLHERKDVFELAAAYAQALLRNHPFVDGNKRVALTVAGVFLELNGFRLEAPEEEAVRATVALAARDREEAEFATWLRESSSPTV
jgi:death-on-curing protein